MATKQTRRSMYRQRSGHRRSGRRRSGHRRSGHRRSGRRRSGHRRSRHRRSRHRRSRASADYAGNKTPDNQSVKAVVPGKPVGDIKQLLGPLYPGGPPPLTTEHERRVFG